MNRELIMNKIFAVIFILFGAFTIPLCDWDGTFFLFTVYWVCIYLLKKNWIYCRRVFMGRAEMRRARKEEKKYKTVTYTLTQEQLDKMVRDKIGDELERVKKEATDDAVNTAMVLLLTLPLEVLMDHYWTKSYAKRIPKFTDLVLEYYERWQDGELDMDKLKEDLWVYGGVKLVEGEANG